jgi:hypothetical protein
MRRTILTNKTPPGHEGRTGARENNQLTLSQPFIRENHETRSTLKKARPKRLEDKILQCRNQDGFEQVAETRGVRPFQRKEAMAKKSFSLDQGP